MQPISKDDARHRIAELAELFARDTNVYKSAAYNETQTRHQFIDPFFEALGWDVQNKGNVYEAYKDVIHEDAIKVQGGTKAPDYCFRVGGARKFFVEAKKPAANLHDDPTFAYQLRRYGWSAHLALSVLTDFEEFAVYDCRIRPNQKDNVATARILYISYAEYIDRFDEFWDLFAKESVYKGSLDRYAEDKKRLRGTAPVDKEFLKEIERWRELLAKNIALRNPDLNEYDLSFAVQRTIDRIIFLRICEDRGIEGYGTLQALCNGANVYARLKQRFDRAEERYNSGIFHFEVEKGISEAPDTVTPRLAVDDKPLADILKHLYFPDSPYEFSMIGADILGQVYEQFLGKVIRLTAGHRAKVEEKPEVRKAGGVYYTPTYIVDYIVKNTVGKLCEGKRPADVKKLRILDPACGSGSFLLGAYQFLIDYCRDWYVKDGPEKHTGTNRVFQGAGGQWRLTTAEKRDLLTRCIYGVDIDSQAVEVTKLNLLLKCLEGESRESISQHNLFFKERALPNLGANIKCGNSLIGSDFFDDFQEALFDDETVRRVNPFDWDGADGFPEIMKSGGFDAVIGNPPYVRIQKMKDSSPEEVIYFKDKYSSSKSGNYDIYFIFVEKSLLSMLKDTGLLGFIIPYKFFISQYGKNLRSFLSLNESVAEIVHFGDQQVFPSATTYCCLLFLTINRSKYFYYKDVKNIDHWKNTYESDSYKYPSEYLSIKEWYFTTREKAGILTKLENIESKLSDIAHLFVGLQTDADDTFILEELEVVKDRVLCRSKVTESEHWFEKSHLKHLLKGSLNIGRYHLFNVNKRLIFPYKNESGKSILINKDEYKSKYPLTWKYLNVNYNRLASRNVSSENWYGYVYKKNHAKFGLKKILVPSISYQNSFSLDNDGEFYFVGSGGGWRRRIWYSNK